MLNRIRWHPVERKHRFTVVIADRMIQGGIRSLEASSITEIHASYFLLLENGELKHIPLHHVVRVIDEVTGAVLWEKGGARSR